MPPPGDVVPEGTGAPRLVGSSRRLTGQNLSGGGGPVVATRHGEGPAVQTHPEGTEDLRGRARCRQSGISAARTRGTHSRRQTAGATAPHYHRAVRGAWRPFPPTRCDTRRRRLPPNQSEVIDDAGGRRVQPGDQCRGRRGADRIPRACPPDSSSARRCRRPARRGSRSRSGQAALLKHLS